MKTTWYLHLCPEHCWIGVQRSQVVIVSTHPCGRQDVQTGSVWIVCLLPCLAVIVTRTSLVRMPSLKYDVPEPSVN